MKYLAKPNLILEALLYLCTRADSQGQGRLEEHFSCKGPQASAAFRAHYAPFEALKQQLDYRVAVPQETLSRLFRNLEGFPNHTEGVYSPAFLLLAPAACRCGGDAEAFRADLAACSPDRAAQNILTSLDLADKAQGEHVSASAQLVDSIISMSLPAQTRMALLELHKNYRLVIQESSQCLQAAILAMKALNPEMQDLADGSAREICAVGCEAYAHEIADFHVDSAIPYRIQPLLIMPASNFFMNVPEADGSLVVYCGVLRHTLLNMEFSAEATRNQVYEAIRLLGDRTRFDIFCYLQDHPAYGQELSSHFGLARNTIHHHMSQLFKAGLVRCTVEGTRTYYSIDKDRYSKLLEQQRQLFLHGYQTPAPYLKSPDGTEIPETLP